MAGEKLFMDVRASPNDLGKAVVPAKDNAAHTQSAVQFWVAVQALEMGWRDLAAVAVGKGGRQCEGYEKEPQAVQTHGVLEQLCLNIGLFQGIRNSSVNISSYILPLRHQVLAQCSVCLTVSSEELQAAAHLQLDGEPGKHVVPRGMKAATKHTGS